MPDKIWSGLAAFLPELGGSQGGRVIHRTSFHKQAGLTIVVTAVLVALVLGWSDAAMRASDSDSAAYLDSRACQACHAEIYQGYRQVGPPPPTTGRIIRG